MTSGDDSLDRIADSYHTSGSIPDIHIENICQEHFVAWLCNRIAPNSRVLDLGYGDGIVTAALSALDIKLTVVDGAVMLVELAQARHPNVTCVHSYFETYSPAIPYDVVIASHVLEHVVDPRRVLRAIRKWLVPGGEIVAVVPNSHSLHRRLAVIMGLQPALNSLSPRDHLVGHQRVYAPDELRADIASAGFSIREERGFFLKSLPNSMMLNFSRQLLDALNQISPSLPPSLLANLVVVASPCE